MSPLTRKLAIIPSREEHVGAPAMPVESSIPVIDVSSLFSSQGAERARADEAILLAAAAPGFFLARNLPHTVPIGRESRLELLRLFDLPEREIRPLWRKKFDSSHTNVYRGWFPLQAGFLTSKEGIDLGPDVAYGAALTRSDDPLQEPTPVPREQALPGWREAAARYYHGMIATSRALMHSIARSLHLADDFFDDAFDRGLSTLRLIRYPPRVDLQQAAEAEPSLWVEHEGARRYVTGAPHVDSGFLTLLAQHGVGGLQARGRHGEWMDVPSLEGALAVNFGKVLERWSAGRIKATEHRVIGSGESRMSIPFFYEARADAEIRPLPMDPAAAFEPFLYGDYLWATTTQFVEFKGMEGLRRPRRPRNETGGGRGDA
jgi:isopenicillin N synthase-like dioxygenase